MKQVFLSDVCEINPRMDSGISDDAECSFVPMEHVDDISGTIAKTGIRLVGDVKKGYTFFKNDDVIFAKITPCMENGKCAIGRNLKNGIAFGSTEFHVVRAKEGIIPEWVYYYLRQEHVRQSATHWFRGTAGQQRVPATFLEELKIPLPPLDEQKRIASLLARADRLRGLRRAARELGDSLLQGVFLEMFGDPSVNQKNWKVRTLKSVSLKFSDGPFGSNLKSEHYVPYGVRVIRLQNIGVGKLVDDDKAYISEEHFSELSKHQCLPGDVIVGTLGDPNLRAIILPPSIPQALNKADCVQIRVNPKICNNQFVCWLLNMPQTLQLASGMIHGQTRARINMGRLAELAVPIPPLSLQEEFARVVARVEGLRGRMSESERQVEGLFASLLAESFGG